ncbi:unnamed protein product [Ambrosiozyma monospora]|uniref:Unnamed protein product n=1 Tax=Ambrosiozyma monospora TaxID=43982 RepID=A0ACB5T985_AMBMO|nr:unnamed protein product [Ambrosiozyma monospora]
MMMETHWSDNSVPYYNLVFWGYLFILGAIRLATISKGLSHRLPDLWYHSFFLYTIYLTGSFFLLRSAILGHTNSKYGAWFYISQFFVSSLLFLVSGSFNYGDKPVALYRQNNLTPSPEFRSSFFGIISYAWIDDMVLHAYRNGLKMNDIWGLRIDDFAFPVLDKYHKTYKNYRFTIRLFAQFKYQLAVQAFLAAIQSVLVFFPAILLKKILEYIDDPITTPSSLAWLFSFLMLAVNVIAACFDGRCLFIGRRVCTRMKAVIIGEVYSKALRRSFNSSKENKIDKDSDKAEASESIKDNDSKKSEELKDAGEAPKDLGSIINLMSVDAFKVSEICGYLHYFVNSFIMAFIAIYLLHDLLGWPALVGGFTIILLIPLNYKISRIMGDYQNAMLKVTDRRIQKLNETFQNIRIIKFFAWEKKFAQEILDIREEELDYLKRRSYIWVCGAFIWFITPTLIAFVAFYLYSVVEGKPLTPPIAFTALSLFNLLRAPLDQFADMLSFVIQSKVMPTLH